MTMNFLDENDCSEEIETTPVGPFNLNNGFPNPSSAETAHTNGTTRSERWKINPLITAAFDILGEPVLIVKVPERAILWANTAAHSILGCRRSAPFVTPTSSSTGTHDTADWDFDTIFPNDSLLLKPKALAGRKNGDSADHRHPSLQRQGSRKTVLVRTPEKSMQMEVSLSPLPPATVTDSKGISTEDVVVITLTKCNFRYQTEFEELDFLGKGGFGLVFRCRNKLDGQDYAIKKVRLKSSIDELKWMENGPQEDLTSPAGQNKKVVLDRRMIREAKTLALLSSHPNVVRYYGCWIGQEELGLGVGLDDDVSSDEETESDDGEEDAGDTDEPDPDIGGRWYVEKSSRGQAATLYIQMQFCPFRDLRRWIDERGSVVNRQQNLWILQQVVAALTHIHSQNVIHRDLKPDNVFLDGTRVLIGDFGLAKTVIPEDGIKSHEVSNSEQGTLMYVAPEIIYHQKATTKSDIYSLGIIITELFVPFSTKMERSIVLSKVRETGVLPQSFSESYPEEALLAREALNPDHLQRPSAGELLTAMMPITSPQTLSPYITELVASRRGSAHYWEPETTDDQGVVGLFPFDSFVDGEDVHGGKEVSTLERDFSGFSLGANEPRPSLSTSFGRRRASTFHEWGLSSSFPTSGLFSRLQTFRGGTAGGDSSSPTNAMEIPMPNTDTSATNVPSDGDAQTPLSTSSAPFPGMSWREPLVWNGSPSFHHPTGVPDFPQPEEESARDVIKRLERDVRELTAKLEASKAREIKLQSELEFAYNSISPPAVGIARSRPSLSSTAPTSQTGSPPQLPAEYIRTKSGSELSSPSRPTSLLTDAINKAAPIPIPKSRPK